MNVYPSVSHPAEASDRSFSAFMRRIHDSDAPRELFHHRPISDFGLTISYARCVKTRIVPPRFAAAVRQRDDDDNDDDDDNFKAQNTLIKKNQTFSKRPWKFVSLVKRSEIRR